MEKASEFDFGAEFTSARVASDINDTQDIWFSEACPESPKKKLDELLSQPASKEFPVTKKIPVNVAAFLRHQIDCLVFGLGVDAVKELPPGWAEPSHAVL